MRLFSRTRGDSVHCGDESHQTLPFVMCSIAAPDQAASCMRPTSLVTVGCLASLERKGRRLQSHSVLVNSNAEDLS